MFKVRNYTEQDFSMLNQWWVAQDEFPPTKEMLPKESTFICEQDGVPLVSITLYLTNSKEFCMLDNFIGNPKMRGEIRKAASDFIIKYSEVIAKELGYKSILCFATKPKLKEYYPTFGYMKRCDNIASFNKELV